MAAQVADLVWETSTTTGTGNLTTSRNGGYQRGDEAFGTGDDGADNPVIFIVNRDAAAAEWEVCPAYWSATGTLVRGTPLLSSNSNSAVDFGAGTKDVTNDIPAALQRLALIGRNRLINGLFIVDKRNAGASTAVADDVYCFDRWYALTQTASVNVSQLTDPENGYTHAIRLTQNQASAQRMGIAQIIEGRFCKDLRGKSGTLSIRARISNSQAIRYAIIGWTGTEDSVTSDFVNDWTSSTYTAGNFFTTTSTSVLAVGAATPSANTWTTLAALTGSLGTSFNNIAVMVWTEGTAAQNVTLDFDSIQFEEGTQASPCEKRLNEHALCQRYYYKRSGAIGDMWIRATSGTFRFLSAWWPEMRAAPTVSYTENGAGTASSQRVTTVGAELFTDAGDTTTAVTVSDLVAVSEL